MIDWLYFVLQASVSTVADSDAIQDITPLKATCVSSSKVQPDDAHSVLQIAKRIKQEKWVEAASYLGT